MNNTLTALNNYLFEELERLNGRVFRPAAAFPLVCWRTLPRCPRAGPQRVIFYP